MEDTIEISLTQFCEQFIDRSVTRDYRHIGENLREHIESLSREQLAAVLEFITLDSSLTSKANLYSKVDRMSEVGSKVEIPRY